MSEVKVGGEMYTVPLPVADHIATISVRVAELEGHLLAADAVAKEIDLLVKANAVNSRSPLSDARLNYGEPFEYAHTKAAEAGGHAS